LFLDKDCASNGSTLTHELGHSFSLLHTHSSSNGEELVNGSNCSSAGDLLCDTPADPKLSSSTVSSNCEYIGTELDNQQNAYSPDPKNFMSYSRKECRTLFSPQQLAQMQDYYDIEGGFLDCLELSTDTEETILDKTIEIYPNPSSSSFFVKGLPKDAQLELQSMTGKLISAQTYTPQSDSEVLELTALHQVQPGLYFLKINFKNQIVTKKIIKL